MYLKLIRQFDCEKLSALVPELNKVTSTSASIMAGYWAVHAFLKVFYEKICPFNGI